MANADDMGARQRHPRFRGNWQDLLEFEQLATSPIRSPKRGTALERWSEYKLQRQRDEYHSSLSERLAEEVRRGEITASLAEMRLQGGKGEYIRSLTHRAINLTGADLISLPGSERKGIIIGYVDLRGVILDDACLQGAWLKGANLENASMLGADLSGARLLRADLRRADLDGSQIFRERISARPTYQAATYAGRTSAMPIWSTRILQTQILPAATSTAYPRGGLS